MNFESYFYNCSPDYINSIDPSLESQITAIINKLPKRQTQSEINADLFWLLASEGWNFDLAPQGPPPADFHFRKDRKSLKEANNRRLCRTSTTLQAKWHSDFGKAFASKLVQIEAQFGKVEAMFKDFCGFRIAYAERRLALGIEIVLSEPTKYFAHRKNSIGGMASFSIAKETLTTIGLECPIWLIGIGKLDQGCDLSLKRRFK
jgi:hypothetical protein